MHRLSLFVYCVHVCFCDVCVVTCSAVQQRPRRGGASRNTNRDMNPRPCPIPIDMATLPPLPKALQETQTLCTRVQRAQPSRGCAALLDRFYAHIALAERRYAPCRTAMYIPEPACLFVLSGCVVLQSSSGYLGSRVQTRHSTGSTVPMYTSTAFLRPTVYMQAALALTQTARSKATAMCSLHARAQNTYVQFVNKQALIHELPLRRCSALLPTLAAEQV
jgi:hypothetical protein